MDESRRGLITKVVVGTGIVWAAPVIESVTLKAAAASPAPGGRMTPTTVSGHEEEPPAPPVHHEPPPIKDCDTDRRY